MLLRRQRAYEAEDFPLILVIRTQQRHHLQPPPAPHPPRAGPCRASMRICVTTRGLVQVVAVANCVAGAGALLFGPVLLVLGFGG